MSNLILVHSQGASVVLCVHYQYIIILLPILPIVSLLILLYFILFSNDFFLNLVDNYTLCFIGSSYYNYISV